MQSEQNMQDTVTIVAIQKDGYVSVRVGTPKHTNMQYPWVYIDTHGNKYDKVWHNKAETIYVVEER